ncbi:MAG: O-methyltransferase [Chloroflexi bacterium]|nr:MAG: O-methyltransferase [Chloroflexota bacterium]
MSLNEEIQHYLVDLFGPEDEALRHAQETSESNGLPPISLTPAEGRLLQWLAQVIKAKKAVEIGTLGGYSGIWLTRGLAPDGKLYTLDINAKHAEVARANFEYAGLGDRVEILLGDAKTSLEQLNNEAPFDFVFIDADKTGYPDYLRWAVKHLRSGGIVAAHNALRHGRITTPESDDDHAMRTFNQMLADEPSLESMVIAMGDGMAVGIKR